MQRRSEIRSWRGRQQPIDGHVDAITKIQDGFVDRHVEAELVVGDVAVGRATVEVLGKGERAIDEVAVGVYAGNVSFGVAAFNKAVVQSIGLGGQRKCRREGKGRKF